jgi:formylmethanofuran dehydrogenase subunit D
MKSKLLTAVASASVLLPFAGLPQSFDITTFDPISTGPWSQPGRTTVMVPKVGNGSVTLDGNVSAAEYGGRAATPVTPGLNAWILDWPGDRAWQDETDSSFSFQLAHDDENLYVGVVVKDDVVNSDDPNGSFWKDDSIEIVVDALGDRLDNNTDNSKDAFGGHCYVNFKGLFSAWDDNSGSISGTSWSTAVPWKYGVNEDVYGMGKEVTGGWQVEVRFKKRLFEDPTAGNRLRNGYRMGLNIGLDDDDKQGQGTNGSGARTEDLELQYFWANRQRAKGLTRDFLDALSDEEKQTRGYLANLESGVDATGRLSHGGTGDIVFGYDTPSTGSILFVASDDVSPINADASLIALLEAKGYTVTVFNSTGSTPDALRAAAQGKQLVFISESIGSTSVVDPAGDGTGVFSLKNTDVPVISFEAYMYDNADWTLRTSDGSNNFIDWGNSGRTEVDGLGIGDARDSLYIRNTTHPITTGLSGKVKVYRELYSFTFGKPSADADVLASLEQDGSFPVLFVYDKGDKLVDGSVAPNKRIGLFLGQAANPTTNYGFDLNMLNDTGMTLFLNTVAYAIGGGAKPTLAVARNGDRIVVTYGGGTLESSDSVTGPWAGENAASPASFATSTIRKFYRVRG